MAGSSRSVHVGRNIVSTRRGGDGRVERVAIAERKCERDRGRACTIFSCDSNYFGEMAQLSDQTQNATIRARSAMNVLIIPKHDFNILRKASWHSETSLASWRSAG